ncbi:MULTISPECIES: glycosyltransferase [unclassified Cobetia]|uniref:glycosyltransferase n=1 Tax=unclassified Cobetia TaxID=2609414 RepID=UPI00178CE1BE|nr:MULTISPECIES: glycosyltransferase [unclassified Cobetia]MBE2170231.1 glycosyltransferase [Cobetia sp. 2AS1]MDH2446987.1 glycosyltransferase [Cobetia sp. 2AS]
MAKVRILHILHTIEKGGGVQERRCSIINSTSHIYDHHIIVPKLTQNDIELKSSVKVESLNLRFNKESLLVFTLFYPLLNFLKANRAFDIIFISPVTIAIPCIILKMLRLTEAKIISSVHNAMNTQGLNITSIKNVIYLSIFKSLSKNIEKLVFVSEGLKKDLENKFLKDTKKSLLIYNPVVDEDYYNAMSQESIGTVFSENKFSFLTIGRLHPQKNYPLMISAFKAIDSSDIELVIIGDGPDELKLKSLAGDVSNIKFLGHQDNPYKYLAMCDAFILTSQWEGFGNVVVEALYFDKKVVVSDCDYGPSEIIEQGKWGAIFPKDDISSLIDVIKATVNTVQPAFTRSRALVFSSDNSIKSYKDMFDSLLLQ